MRFNPYALARAAGPPDNPTTTTTSAVVTEALAHVPIPAEPPPGPHEAFIALYGRPGADPVAVAGDQVALTLTLRHNDSHGACDHFDHHAGLGCPSFLVLQVRRQSQTEALARKALSLCPELHRLDWTWHAENYAGGHGNHLRSSVVALPDALRSAVARHTRRTRDGGEITHAWWELEFVTLYRGGSSVCLTPHRHYGQKPLADTPMARDFATGPITAECRLNEAHRGVEIHFSRRPADAELAPLRANRAWRYTGYSRCWYAKQSPETIAWAEAFCAQFSAA